MMTAKQQETFGEMVESWRSSAAAADALAPLRGKLWERYCAVGLPDRKVEAYRYLRLRSLFSCRYVPAAQTAVKAEEAAFFVYPECAGSAAIFVNGIYSEELSDFSNLPQGVVILPLSDAMATYRSFLSNQWGAMAKEERDPFVLINGALHCGGLFIYLPPGTQLERPLQIVNVIAAGQQPMFLQPRVELFAGKNCEADVVASSSYLSGSDYGINGVFNASVEENSHVRYYQVNLEQSDHSIWFFDAVRAQLKRSATFKAVNVNNGSRTVRSDYSIRLCGEGAEAELDGVWMLADKNESHTNVLIDHQAPNCRSRQLFKGVLKGFSRSSFEGKILVRREAQKTDAFQLNNNLLLDERTQADSKPNLEIFADDVKASHGATFGCLDAEQLFYLKSRGFSHVAASNLLVYGFCKEVIERVELPTLFQRLKSEVEGYVR